LDRTAIVNTEARVAFRDYLQEDVRSESVEAFEGLEFVCHFDETQFLLLELLVDSRWLIACGVQRIIKNQYALQTGIHLSNIATTIRSFVAY
jgi:hypothetical protein